jgi:hypothetical protein
MLNMLKNRLVLRPNGEPVIGPPILSHTNPVHKLPFHFHNVLLNIILTSVLQNSVFFQGFQTKILYTFRVLKLVFCEHADTLHAQ